MPSISPCPWNWLSIWTPNPSLTTRNAVTVPDWLPTSSPGVVPASALTAITFSLPSRWRTLRGDNSLREGCQPGGGTRGNPDDDRVGSVRVPFKEVAYGCDDE